MDDDRIDEGGSAALLRRLRPLIADDAAEAAPGWRDDMRLFCLTWAAGFVFFLVVIA